MSSRPCWIFCRCKATYKAYPSVSQSVWLIPSAPELTGHVIYETLVCAIFWPKKWSLPRLILCQMMRCRCPHYRCQTWVRWFKCTQKSRFAVGFGFASRAYFEPLSAGCRFICSMQACYMPRFCAWMTIYLFGTVNMDMRSFYLNMEVSMAIYNRTMTSKSRPLATWIPATKWAITARWMAAVALGQNSWTTLFACFSPLL